MRLFSRARAEKKDAPPPNLNPTVITALPLRYSKVLASTNRLLSRNRKSEAALFLFTISRPTTIMPFCYQKRKVALR
jgi:hypothetical protein